MNSARVFAVAVCVCSFCVQAPAQEVQPPDSPSDRESAGATATEAADADFIGRLNVEIDRQSDSDGSEPGREFGNDTGSTLLITMLRSVFALCIVLALILGLYYGTRRWGKKVPLLAGPGLGTVLGRIHLERGTTLHFLRTAGRVLVVGVNANSVSLVADFDAARFDAPRRGEQDSEEPAPFNPDSFLAQLQASSEAMGRQATDDPLPPIEDDEIASLRGDIQRLQRYLREESRETQD